MTMIELAGETIGLMAERAFWWPRRKTLIVADVHFGKAAAFRAQAVPLPGGTTEESLARLDHAIGTTGAERLICLGDLLHAREGRATRTIETVASWRRSRSNLALSLIRGNHDMRAGDPPADWGIECANEPALEPPFALVHHPVDIEGAYALAGHIHPAIRLHGPGTERLKLRCFHFGPSCGTLPAFGEFTGLALIRRAPQDRIYAIAGEEVLAV